MSNTEVVLKINGDVSVLRLQPGDTVIVRYQQILTSKQKMLIGDMLKSKFQNNRVIVLDTGTQVEIMRNSI